MFRRQLQGKGPWLGDTVHHGLASANCYAFQPSVSADVYIEEDRFPS